MSYVYRFDSLSQLREIVRNGDGMLRPRRAHDESGKPTEHHQLADALRKVPSGHGVYRLSFWKTLDAALIQLPSADIRKDPSCLQRIPASHPSLIACQRGQDQYLEGAWIYWTVQPFGADPNVCPISISHEQMDIATPAGAWEPFVHSMRWNDCDLLAGWQTIRHAHYTDLRPGIAHVRRALSPCKQDRRDIILLRQRALDRGTSANAHPHVALGLFNQAARLFGVRHPQKFRWIFTWECERIHGFEVKFSLSVWQKTLGELPDSIELHLIDGAQTLEILAAFDVNERLLSGQRWDYGQDARAALAEGQYREKQRPS